MAFRYHSRLPCADAPATRIFLSNNKRRVKRIHVSGLFKAVNLFCLWPTWGCTDRNTSTFIAAQRYDRIDASWVLEGAVQANVERSRFRRSVAATLSSRAISAAAKPRRSARFRVRHCLPWNTRQSNAQSTRRTRGSKPCKRISIDCYSTMNSKYSAAVTGILRHAGSKGRQRRNSLPSRGRRAARRIS